MKKEQTTGPAAVESPLEPLPDYAAIRESKGIELKRLCTSTKIRISYLEAIEKGQFEQLPEAIYAETFIRTYARELGIDAGLILSHYRQYLKKTETPQEAVGQTRPKQVERVKRFSNFKIPLRAVGWTISILVIVGFLVSFFSTYMTYKKPELIQSSSEIRPATLAPASDQQKPPEQSAASALPGSPAEKEAAAREAAKPAAPARTSYKLMVEATETTWLNIVEDDSPPYEVLLRPGERIEREANEKFSIDVGNAGGVSVTFQGKSLGTLGKSGQVVHLNLPDEAQD